MSLQTIQRAAVRSWLSAVRLPLSAAEVVVRKQGSDWPPAVVFQGFGAGVKRGIGTLVKDEELVREGTLERAKVDQLERAADLEASAERRRQEAQARFEDRKETVAERDRRLEREQQERKAQLAREEADRKREVEEAARRKEQAARAAGEARAKVVADKKRQAKSVELAADAKALEHEKEAVAARSETLEVDRALERTKAARKRS